MQHVFHQLRKTKGLFCSSFLLWILECRTSRNLQKHGYSADLNFTELLIVANREPKPLKAKRALFALVVLSTMTFLPELGVAHEPLGLSEHGPATFFVYFYVVHLAKTRDASNQNAWMKACAARCVRNRTCNTLQLSGRAHVA